MQKFYENILNTVGCSICVYDLHERILYYNNAFKNAYLQGSSDYIGKFYQDIPSEEYHKASCLKEALKSHDVISIKRKRGLNGTISVAATPLVGEDGQVKMITETIMTPFKAALLPIRTDQEDLPAQDMILSDRSMHSIVETVSRISNFDSTILITGESGTGKSMLARYIHANSKRFQEPFVTINCATIPETLIESELFGYASGAFTGAHQKGKVGMVQLADKGTLFLDEIGLLPINLQAKFLQLIQEKTYTPVGSLTTKSVDIRIISATNLNLKTQIAEKKFREDLYYRLRVIEFYMPPLRERPDAIEPLIDYFLRQCNRKYGIEKTISATAKDLLKHQRWTGNVRELQYVMERLVVTSPDNQITSADIPPLEQNAVPDVLPFTADVQSFDEAISSFEAELLKKAFQKYKSSYKVAEALQITQSKASRLLRKYHIK